MMYNKKKKSLDFIEIKDISNTLNYWLIIFSFSSQVSP